jgi:CPA2 family monovalent cation:H+ antiporter-2
MSTPGHDDPLLSVLVLLAGGLASIALSTKTGLNFLLALIAFGVLLGPFGLDWASHAGAVELLAELGVAFLLFDIGLHLSAKSLWAARRYLFAFAPLQIGLCSVLLWTGLRLAPGLSDVGLWLAAALSLSSTAVVLQLFRDSGEEQTPIGRAALAALLAQDLFVILLLVLIPAIGSDSGLMSAALPALGRLGVALVLCIGGGRLILAPLLGSVARLDRPEAFTAAALFVVLSTAWLTLSFGLSIALGAFLAGVALAEGRYAPAVQAELAPFRGLLLSLFFLTVGMSIELPAVFANVIPVLSLTIGILVTKTLGTLFAARLVGKGWGSALRLGLSLSQGSEFALVVFAVAGQHALLSPVQRAPLAAAIVLSIGVTPLQSYSSGSTRRWRRSLGGSTGPLFRSSLFRVTGIAPRTRAPWASTYITVIRVGRGGSHSLPAGALRRSSWASRTKSGAWHLFDRAWSSRRTSQSMRSPDSSLLWKRCKRQALPCSAIWVPVPPTSRKASWNVANGSLRWLGAASPHESNAKRIGKVRPAPNTPPSERT